jgi:hypothetical protein
MICFHLQPHQPPFFASESSMRYFRFLFDLPWWAGLPIFLSGTAIVVHWYAIGLIIALFGAWTFSKLIVKENDAAIGWALVGFPLFFFSMLIPARFSFDFPIIDLCNHLSTTATYAMRSALSLASGLIAFQSMRF